LYSIFAKCQKAFFISGFLSGALRLTSENPPDARTRFCARPTISCQASAPDEHMTLSAMGFSSISGFFE
jgi:hypothetical protein